jgi:hypothetical protein
MKPRFNLAAAPHFLAFTAAVIAGALSATAAWAQADGGNQPGYEPAPRRATARRNDAYTGPDNSPGLGTLSGTAPSSYQDPYARNPAPPAYGAPNRAGGPQVEAQAAGGGYEPRYGAPERPYGADSAAAGYGGSGPSQGYGAPAGRDDYRPAPPPAYAQNVPPPYRQDGGQGYGGAAPGQYPSQGYGQGYGGQSQGYGSQGYSQPQSGYGQPYSPPPQDFARDRRDDDAPPPGPRVDDRRDGTYSSNEILNAGHKFFGSISQGLANVVENAFKRQGRPNGYILGEEAGGAFIAGLRYGEGMLYTRDAGTHRVYWQGPSLGYDVGGAGSKTMILVYNLRSPDEIYERFGGIDGSAYFVGGVGMTLLTRDHVTLAPIRTGVGLRLGANVGYLKFTPSATWNPF